MHPSDNTLSDISEPKSSSHVRCSLIHESVLVLFRQVTNLNCLQDQRPTRRRAPPPSLTSLDKLNPYKTASASTLSPNYLTPPVTDIPLSSPPPLLIANDYLNAHVDHKKRRTAGGRKPRSSPGDHSQFLNGVLASNCGSPASGSELGDARSIAADVDSLADKRLAPDSAADLKRQVPHILSTSAVSGPEVQGNLAIPSHGSLEPKADTAATSLRKMSQVTKEPSLFGSRRLSRISQALTTAVHQTRAIPGADDGTPEDVGNSQAGEMESSPTPHRPFRPKGHLFKGTKVEFDTPATITLRKASDAYFVVFGHTTANGDPSTTGSVSFPSKSHRSNRRPSVALMDFQSKRLTEHRKSLWYSLPLLSDQNERDEYPTEDKAEEKPSSQKAIHELSSFFSNVQGPSTVAEPAITFTDVHTAPQSFASIPYSRSRSSSTLREPRRTSSVHIRTQTSVHEIIWRENETSSGSSSQASISPIQTNKPTISLGTANPSATKATTQSALMTPTSNVENSTLLKLPEGNLFDWSWSTQQAGEPLSLHDSADPPASTPVVESPPIASTKGRSDSKESSQSSVQSFPPLMNRQNTIEWRRAPLVDLNDPMAGRVTRMWLPQMTGGGGDEPKGLSEEPASIGSFGKRLSMDGQGGREGVAERRRRSSAHPYAPARVGLSGRVGSSIGSSSHKRMVCFV